MKKSTILLATLIVFCLLFAFASCDPGNFYFDKEYLADIVCVELIEYDNPEQKHFFSWVPDHTSDLKSFDNDKISVIETLDNDIIPNFLDTLCKHHILLTYYAYDSPNKLCLKLTYSNGDFVIINCTENSFAGYIGKFSSDGIVKQFIGCFSNYDSFKTLVNDYFQLKI